MTYVVSIVIAVVLLLQLVATFDMYPRLVSRQSHLFWPFMDYPMYRYPRYEGTVIERYRVLGRATDGSQVDVTPEDLGLNDRRFRDVLIAAVRQRDMSRAAAFAELYKVRTGIQLVGMRVERYGDILTRDGLKPGPSVQVAEISLHTK